MLSLPGTADPYDEDIDRLREVFIANLWLGMAAVAVIVIPATLLRAHGTGWTPLFGLHLVVAATALAVHRVQARLPFGWRVALMCGLLWVVGFPGVLSFGLSASGLWWLLLSCLIAATLGSTRVGIAVCIGTGIALALVAQAFISGGLQPIVPADDYLRRPSSWIAMLMVTGIFATLVVRAFSSYMRATAILLHQVKEQRNEIERLSMHDPLTSLPMSALANDRIEMAFHTARRTKCKVALLYLDLDGFKAVNDSAGHVAGDTVLAACARRMEAAIRQEDTVARIGGDEFLVVVGALSDADDAVLVADKLLQAIMLPMEFGPETLRVGASIGIAIYPDHGRDGAELRHLADQAMYAAKRRGGNCIAFTEPGDPKEPTGSAKPAGADAPTGTDGPTGIDARDQASESNLSAIPE
ncbi:hypothetical protein BH11PSE14_BH11PSE14_15810 [soil metagenome]